MRSSTFLVIKLLLIGFFIGLIFIISHHYLNGLIGPIGLQDNLFSLIQFFLVQLVPLALLGLIAGLILNGRVANSYLISIFTLLYTYSVSILLQFTRGYFYIVYFILVGLVSALLFYALYKIFNLISNKTKKIILASVLLGAWPFFFLLCATIGFYVVRILATAQYSY